MVTGVNDRKGVDTQVIPEKKRMIVLCKTKE